jgi:hypothetical protein
MAKKEVCDYCEEEIADYRRLKNKEVICENCMEEELEQVRDEYIEQNFKELE